MRRMTEEQYQRVTKAICSRKYGPFLVRALERIITMILFALYPIYLGMRILTASGAGSANLAVNPGAISGLNFMAALPSVIVPATGFFAVTLLRSSLHAKRPYELYDFEPVIRKDTIEHSFPSRHVFSATIIAMTYLQTDLENGLELLVLAAILAVLRVVGGVHFPKDVITGYLGAVVWGLIGYLVIF